MVTLLRASGVQWAATCARLVLVARDLRVRFDGHLASTWPPARPPERKAIEHVNPPLQRHALCV